MGFILMGYICSICGQIHYDTPAFAFNTPYHYNMLSPADQEKMAIVSEDWCIIRHDTQEDHFIRAVLHMPIAGTNEFLQYGLWVSLSEKNFVYYMDNFNEDLEGTTFFGYICNQIPEYDNTLLIKSNVVCGSKGQRPTIFPHEENGDNPFVHDFLHGISKEAADKRIHLLLK